MPERVAVRLLNGRPDRRANVGEEKRRGHVARELAQVLVIPGRLGAVEDPGGGRGIIPANAESVAVRGLGPELGVQALVDQRVDRGVEHL